MNDEFVYISNRLLKANHICFDVKSFKTELISHPYYPAIWALTDTLKPMNIELKVVKTDWEFLHTLENPSLVHFLVLHGLGKENFLSQKACHLTTHTDCNAVLNSKAAKIGNISMSDIGIIYFSGGLILLLGSYIYGNWEKTTYLLGLISILSIPYSIFSIYYQYFIVKRWCILCLGTLFILASEIICFWIFSPVSNINIPTLIIVMTVTICNGILWIMCRSKIKECYKLEETKILYLSLKKNNEIFTSLWRGSKPCNNITFKKFKFINNGSNVIDIALSLHCNFCAETFEQIKSLFDKRSSSYSFHFYFAWSKNDIEQHFFIHRLISVYLLQNEEAFFLYLQNWYNSKDYAILNSENVSCLINEDIFQDYMNGCYEWYNINHITQTPTIYVSGKLLPSIYNVRDLFYFSDFLFN